MASPPVADSNGPPGKGAFPGRGARWDVVGPAILFCVAVIATGIAYIQPPRPFSMAEETGEKTLGSYVRQLLYPIEQNAFFRPAGSEARPHLAAIAVSADGQRGLAVGVDGVLLFFSEGGRVWEHRKFPRPSQTADPQAERPLLTAVAMSAEGSEIWLGTADGQIFQSVDSGVTWTQSEINTLSVSSAMIGAIQSIVIDGDHLLAVTEAGLLLRTEDGVTRWVEVYPGSAGAQQSKQAQLSKEAMTTGDYRLLAKVAAGSDGKQSWALAVGMEGKMVASSDSGWNWEPLDPPTKGDILGASLLDGQAGYVVGQGGEIFFTADNGRSWMPRISGTANDLYAVATVADHAGIRAWAIGRDGTLTGNEGRMQWSAYQVSGDPLLTDLALARNGEDVIVVGNEGYVLHSHDGGTSWMTGAEYTRHPEPWLYLLWASLAFSWIAVARFWAGPEIHVAGIAPAIDADAPAGRLDADRLAFRPIVETLSRFIRNAGTKPPLTLSIDGEWGSGKSSLMYMLRSELQTLGYATVWFNPWHHQKEDLLLAALLQHVRAEGLPFFLSLQGLRFRLRLVWRRISFYPFTWMMILLSTAVPIAYFAEHQPNEGYGSYFREILTPAVNLISAIIPPNADTAEKVVGALTDLGLWMLVLFIFGLVFLINGLRAFPLLPAALLSTINSKFSTDKAQLQTDYRRLFGQHFGDVTWALKPYHMVIFIDDLDRCMPEKALEALEATNYLATNGECFIVLGMARARVERLIGLASEKLAAEMAETEGNERRTPKFEADLPRRLRRNYARRYLDKLVQLNIRVPTAESRSLIGLLSQTALPSTQFDAGIGRLAIVLRKVARSFIALAAGAAIIAGAALFLPAPAPRHDEPVAVAPVPEKREDGGQAASAVGAPTTDTANLPAPTQAVASNAPASSVGIVDAAPAGRVFPATYFVPLVVLLAALAVVAAYVTRRPDPTIHDTSAFLDMLPRWNSVITSRQKSPRSVKLFGNIARYTAMMLLEEPQRRPRLVRPMQWRFFRRPAPLPPTATSEPNIADQSDSYAVALAAIFHTRPDLLENESGGILDVGGEASWVAIAAADRIEYLARIYELRAIYDPAAVAIPGADLTAEEIRDVEIRVTSDPDLRDELDRLKLRHTAADFIRQTIETLSGAGLSWPPPPEITQRFRLFVIGAVPRNQAEELRESVACALS